MPLEVRHGHDRKEDLEKVKKILSMFKVSVVVKGNLDMAPCWRLSGCAPSDQQRSVSRPWQRQNPCTLELEAWPQGTVVPKRLMRRLYSKNTAAREQRVARCKEIGW